MSDSRERIAIGERVVITTRGKKNIYVAEFNDHGVHRRVSLKTANKKVAMERATILAGKLLHGGYQPSPAAVSLRDAGDEYISFLETEGRARKTIVKYRGVFVKLFDYLAELRVTRLSQMLPGHFDRYRSVRKQTCKEKTLYTEGVICKQFFRWAKSRKLVSENPLVDIKLKKPPLVPKPAPSMDEVNTFLAVAKQPLGSQLAVLAFTGMRSGEEQRLQPEDIDLEGNWIHIVSRSGGETKSRRSRKVPIHPRLLPILRALPQGQRPWVFCSLKSRKYPDGNRPMNTKRLNDQFTRLASKLGMQVGREDGYVIHSFRHFFETFSINSNIPQRVVDAWLGHHGDKSMGAVYYKLSDADSQRFMKLVPFGAPNAA